MPEALDHPRRVALNGAIFDFTRQPRTHAYTLKCEVAGHPRKAMSPAFFPPAFLTGVRAIWGSSWLVTQERSFGWLQAELTSRRLIFTDPWAHPRRVVVIPQECGFDNAPTCPCIGCVTRDNEFPPLVDLLSVEWLWPNSTTRSVNFAQIPERPHRVAFGEGPQEQKTTSPPADPRTLGAVSPQPNKCDI